MQDPIYLLHTAILHNTIHVKNIKEINWLMQNIINIYRCLIIKYRKLYVLFKLKIYLLFRIFCYFINNLLFGSNFLFLPTHIYTIITVYRYTDEMENIQYLLIIWLIFLTIFVLLHFFQTRNRWNLWVKFDATSYNIKIINKS